jgi:hypothetical protein
MNNFNKAILQSELKSLIIIIELWIPVLAAMKKTLEDLEQLPINLAILKHQLSKLEQASYIYRQRLNSQGLETLDKSIIFSQTQDTITLEKIEPKFQALIGKLEAAIPSLLALERKIGDLIALRERIEALQEEVVGTQNQEYAEEFALIKQENKDSDCKIETILDSPNRFNQIESETKKRQDNWCKAILASTILIMLSGSLVYWFSSEFKFENRTNDNVTHIQP